MQKDSGLNDTRTRAALGMKKEKCSLLYIDSSRLSFLCVILERSEESRFFFVGLSLCHSEPLRRRIPESFSATLKTNSEVREFQVAPSWEIGARPRVLRLSGVWKAATQNRNRRRLRAAVRRPEANSIRSRCSLRQDDSSDALLASSG